MTLYDLIDHLEALVAAYPGIAQASLGPIHARRYAQIDEHLRTVLVLAQHTAALELEIRQHAPTVIIRRQPEEGSGSG